LGRKSGSLKAKRAGVPAFWKISKKDKRFVYRTTPGPHPKSYSYPLLILLRDILKLTKNAREATYVLNEGKVRVDGRVVRSPRFPVGIMDIVEIPSIGKAYRLIPKDGGIVPAEISKEESSLKLCLVKNKVSGRGAKISCGLHDGRVIFPAAEVDIRPGDSCVVKLPGQQLQASYRLNKASSALLIRGDRSGEIVTVEDIKPGTFSRGSIATVRFGDNSTSELPTLILMPIGNKLPELTISPVQAK
jgi:small subunit ribosomal protein S4e